VTELLDLDAEVCTRDEWIPLADGTRLFARIVVPTKPAGPVPALLEFLPYRITDGTRIRDQEHHRYFAAAGYAGVRVDMRGSGNSTGILLDEYLPQEQADAVEVIAWLAEQPWCSGAIGMFGISWGGFNALQVAAHRPPALKAIITLCFTDDRYATDVHYMGGCLLGPESLPWASTMLGINALPPDPLHFGEGWREEWLRRLEETPFYLEAWLAHQRRDEYWKQGSICEDYAALDCAVFAVGGWADGYTNAIPRTLAGLSAAGVPCKGLIGPWSHKWPQSATPGPNIGFLQECVRFWDLWLKGIETGAMDGPLLRAWMQESVAPGPGHAEWPGRWIAEPAWPPAARPPLVLHPSPTGLSAAPPEEARLDHLGVDSAGLDSGAWCPYGHQVDYPTDQRQEDALALALDGEPLAERLEVFGDPVAALELSCDRPLGLVAVRLCDVAPDGSSLLVSRGLLNLTHRRDHEVIEPVRPGERMSVRVPLDSLGHAFPAGHRIRLTVSPTYWPFAWPSPEPVTLSLYTGALTRLELPVREPSTADEALPSFGAPVQARPERTETDGSMERRITRELGSARAILELERTENTHFAADDLTLADHAIERYSIVDGEPLSARIERSSSHRMRRGGWDISVVTETSMSATADAFLVTSAIDAFEGDVRVSTRHRSVRIPRDGV
jgi:predicted acyl esterase